MNQSDINDTNTKLQDLLERLKAFRDERGWQNQDPKDMAISLVLEANELLELFQWKTGKEVEEESRFFGAIADELSDVLWWVITIAERLNIDPSQAFVRKMDKNAKKYPVSLFNPSMSLEDKNREYYKIKARTRGGHPLVDES